MTESVTIVQDSFRQLMRSYPTGVAVLGLCADSAFHGMTANSLTSVSLDPPLVAVNVRTGSRSATAVLRTGGFTASLLAADQEPIARWFAGHDRFNLDDQFGGLRIGTAPGSGLPFLADSLGYLDCAVRHVVPAGDHHLLIAEVCGLQTLEDKPPLAFHRGGYASVDPLRLIGT
jgi:flavin reductase (DIM6/NTAB) family NADH-FMN oxidoreductase RutF